MNTVNVPTPPAPGPTARRQQKAADVRETTGHGAKSQAVRDKAILALLSEKNIPAAAAKCRIGERTLHRWLTSDAAFQADYSAARQAAFEAGIHRVQALTAQAVDTLEELLGEKKHPSVRLGAARTVVEIGMHQRDAETLLGLDAEPARISADEVRAHLLAEGLLGAPSDDEQLRDEAIHKWLEDGTVEDDDT